MIPDTRLNEALTLVSALVGYGLIMLALRHAPGRFKDWQFWLPLAVGFAVFSAAMTVVLGWGPPEVSHCVKHCFPWGD